MITGINHIGIVVTNIESVVEKFADIYGIEKPEIKYVESRNMKVAVVSIGGSSLELLEDFNETLTLPTLDGKPVENTKENFIHHYALGSTDIEKDVAELVKKGCAKIGDGPKVGVRGKLIQFFHDPATDLLVELSEA